ncbi:HNH endonuclease [Opitutales bacterium]|nr:HNH endonuclease [Opitutales bacterium]
MSSPTAIYGEIEGIPEGFKFENRQAAHDSNIHRGTVQGIAAEGTSICLNEGYADDIDNGDEIIYTGQGGQDDKRNQIADQEFRAGNKFLVESYNQGRPVRVIRGPKLKSAYAPKSGYRYDGLYFIDSYWYETGHHGFKVYRFRLIKQNPEVSVPVADASKPAKKRARVTSTISRLVRDTEIARKVKELYGYRCQICSTLISTNRGPYAEACHIKPLGRPHDGDDSEGNILCLCPNCHVGIDRFGLHILEDLTVQPIGQKITLRPSHQINLDNVRYLASLAD